MHIDRWQQGKGERLTMVRADRTIFAFAVISALVFAGCGTQVIAASKPGAPEAAAPTEQTIIDCKQQYSALKNEVEEKAEPIRKARQQTIASDALCQAITGYEEAELKIIGFVAANLKRCGFSPRISEKLTSVYESTRTLKEKACPKKPLRFARSELPLKRLTPQERDDRFGSKGDTFFAYNAIGRQLRRP